MTMTPKAMPSKSLPSTREYPRFMPKFSPEALRANPDLARFQADLEQWWFDFRSALLQEQQATESTSTLDLSDPASIRSTLDVYSKEEVDALPSGTGSGDMLGSRNLSDVADVPTAQLNLGLVPGVDVAEQSEVDGQAALIGAQAAQITNLKKITIPFLIDGGGFIIASGSKGWMRVPAAFTIQRWEIFADFAGDLTVDVRRATYATLPSFASIAGTDLPALSSQQKNFSTSLTGWNTTIAEGDWLEFFVNASPAPAFVTGATVVLIGTRT